MLVLTRDKGSHDSMRNCSAGRRKTYLNCAFDSLSNLLMARTYLFILGFDSNIATRTCQVCGITLWRCTQNAHIKTEN